MSRFSKIKGRVSATAKSRDTLVFHLFFCFKWSKPRFVIKKTRVTIRENVPFCSSRAVKKGLFVFVKTNLYDSGCYESRYHTRTQQYICCTEYL